MSGSGPFRSANRMRGNGEWLLLTAALIYALYPVISVLVVRTTNPFLAIAQIYFFYALFNIVPALANRQSRNDIKREIARIYRDRESMLAAALDALAHLAFFFALLRGSSIVATSIFETWPFFAMLSSFLFLPDKHRFPGAAKILLSLLAVVGIAILTLQPFDLDLGMLAVDERLIVLSLIAALLGAIASNYHNRLGLLYEVENSISRYFVMQFFRSVHFAFIAALLILFAQPWSDQGITPSLNSLLLTALIGGGVFFLVPLLFRFGVLLSRDEGVYILWYISPVATVIMLWVFGLDTYSTSKALGSMTIIVANILLVAAPQVSRAFSFSMAMLPVMILITLVADSAATPTYFEIIGTYSVVFTIMYGFVYNRVWQTKWTLITEASNLVRHIDKSGGKSALVLDRIQQLLNGRVATHRYRAYLQLCRRHLPAIDAGPDARAALDHIVAMQSEIGRLGELFVVTLLGTGLTIVAFILRPNGYVGDIAALLVGFSTIYMISRLFDMRKKETPVPVVRESGALRDPSMPRALFFRLSWADGFVFVYTLFIWFAAAYILINH